MPKNLGPAKVMTTRGTKAWDEYNIDWYLNTYTDRDIPFLHCISGTGKDSGHTSEFGWRDDPRGWAAVQRARQPFCAFWSAGDGELGRFLRNMRWDKSIPAFSNCSLNNNPGNGAASDGDYYGQINGYLFWDYGSVADEKDKWEMTVYLIGSSPETECTVDVTPRRCSAFRPKAGDTFTYTNTSLQDNKEVQSGQLTADKWGLVTVKGAKVSKGKNRIVIKK
jgi:hypothetical protein